MLVIEPTAQARHHRDAGAADPCEQRQDLRAADGDGVAEREGLDAFDTVRGVFTEGGELSGREDFGER